MVALGFALPAWQHLFVACACINAAALLLYPLVSESARWLLSQGRTEEAKAILQRIVRANNSSMPSQPMVASNSSSYLAQPGDTVAEEGLASSQAGTKAPVTLWPLLKQRRFAVRLFVLLFNWFVRNML